jgi:hypothetical protein
VRLSSRAARLRRSCSIARRDWVRVPRLVGHQPVIHCGAKLFGHRQPLCVGIHVVDLRAVGRRERGGIQPDREAARHENTPIRDQTALAVIALLEGALILSRIAGDTAALETAKAAARTLLSPASGAHSAS